MSSVSKVPQRESAEQERKNIEFGLKFYVLFYVKSNGLKLYIIH